MWRALVFNLILFQSGLAMGADAVVNNSVSSASLHSSLLPTVALAYNGATDLNDRSRQKIYSHTLGLYLDWSVHKKLSLGVSGGLTYISIDHEILRDNRDWLTDIYLGGEYSARLNSTHSLNAQIGAFLPTSEDSQFEGIRSRFLAAMGLKSKLSSWYLLNQRLVVKYVWNTFDYSPVSDELNRSWVTDYGLDNIFVLGSAFIQLGGGLRISTYIDQQSELSYFNQVKLGFKSGSVSAAIAYLNGSYRDDQRLQPLFYDRYKQLVELGLVYAF